MRRQVLASALAAAVALAMAAPVAAAPGNNGNNGKGGGEVANTVDVGTAVYLKGSGSSFDWTGWQNTFSVGGADIDDDSTNVWHLVYSGKAFNQITSMQLTFSCDGTVEVFEWTPDMGPSVNGGGNNKGWVVAAPYGCDIVYVDKGNNNQSDSFLVTQESGKVNFNISGHSQGTQAAYGTLAVSADLWEQYQVQTQWVEPIYRTGEYTTSWTTVCENASCAPVPGGKQNATYLTIDVADLADGPQSYLIGSRDKANAPVGGSFTVSLVDGRVVVTPGDDVVQASFVAKAFDQTPSWGNAGGNKTWNEGDDGIPAVAGWDSSKPALYTAPAFGTFYLMVHGDYVKYYVLDADGQRIVDGYRCAGSETSELLERPFGGAADAYVTIDGVDGTFLLDQSVPVLAGKTYTVTLHVGEQTWTEEITVTADGAELGFGKLIVGDVQQVVEVRTTDGTLVTDPRALSCTP